ncbi:MAG TPA: YgaP-like transmembrane domain [Bacteroidales bacterium]|nr:YgaP-like transmembrane domain [Bacteroidales bacterium]
MLKNVGSFLPALAGVLLITAVAGICPLYMLFGLRTRKAEK